MQPRASWRRRTFSAACSSRSTAAARRATSWSKQSRFASSAADRRAEWRAAAAICAAERGVPPLQSQRVQPPRPVPPVLDLCEQSTCRNWATRHSDLAGFEFKAAAANTARRGRLTAAVAPGGAVQRLAERLQLLSVPQDQLLCLFLWIHSAAGPPS